MASGPRFPNTPFRAPVRCLVNGDHRAIFLGLSTKRQGTRISPTAPSQKPEASLMALRYGSDAARRSANVTEPEYPISTLSLCKTIRQRPLVSSSDHGGHRLGDQCG